MYQILDGKELARKIREELKLKVDKLKENPEPEKKEQKSRGQHRKEAR